MVIFKTIFGSHMYGTNLPTSDQDFKSIFIPSKKDIILQQVKNHRNQTTKSTTGEKNNSEDIDHESFSLQAYLKLLAEGQTVALDMLFSPKEFHLENLGTFSEIVANRKEFLHRGTSSFVGYTRMQAAKYGIKGSRVNSIREILNRLTPYLSIDRNMTIGESLSRGQFFCTEYINIVELTDNHNRTDKYLEVCNRKIPFSAKVQYAVNVFQKIFDEFGHRALLAEKNEGIDWKALMHAVRVSHEAQELLLTGNITFPRPEKDLLLQIRKGELPYKQVAEIIEEGLIKVEQAKENSILPEKPNLQFIEDFVYQTYLEEILK